MACTNDALWTGDEAHEVNKVGIAPEGVKLVSCNTMNRFLERAGLTMRAVNNHVVQLTASGDTQQLAYQYLLLKSRRMYDLRLVLNADELKLTCRVAPKKSTAKIGQQKARMKPYKRDLRATGPATVARSDEMPAPTIIFDGEDRGVV